AQHHCAQADDQAGDEVAALLGDRDLVAAQRQVERQPRGGGCVARRLQRHVDHPVQREEHDGDDRDTDDGVPQTSRAGGPRARPERRRAPPADRDGVTHGSPSHSSTARRLRRRYATANTSEIRMRMLPRAAPIPKSNSRNDRWYDSVATVWVAFAGPPLVRPRMTSSTFSV